MSQVVVNVMPKAEILDPQGKAIVGALTRLGYTGYSIRQGKRFEIDFDDEVTPQRLAEIDHLAETLLANPVIEAWQVVA